MGDNGAIISWSGVRTGRERKAMQVWGDALAFYEKSATDGRIESTETIGFTGGFRDMIGGFMIRGDQTQIETFLESDDFLAQYMRAALVADDLTVTRCTFGAQMARTVGTYFAQVEDLGL
ncbi:MAG: hypothetical protein K1X95_10535 [Acidimicrobiia bacterium]|nr:hypothetical protein [Acidimicrobiia bacterium]